MCSGTEAGTCNCRRIESALRLAPTPIAIDRVGMTKSLAPYGVVVRTMHGWIDHPAGLQMMRALSVSGDVDLDTYGQLDLYSVCFLWLPEPDGCYLYVRPIIRAVVLVAHAILLRVLLQMHEWPALTRSAGVV